MVCFETERKAWQGCHFPEKGDVALHSIVVDGSNSDSDIYNSDKSQHDMKHDHIKKMDNF